MPRHDFCAKSPEIYFWLRRREGGRDDGAHASQAPASFCLEDQGPGAADFPWEREVRSGFSLTASRCVMQSDPGEHSGRVQRFSHW